MKFSFAIVYQISLLQPVTAIWCGDPTWIAPNFGFLKMCNFDISVVYLGFGAILGDPKFGQSMLGHHTIWLSLATLD